MKRYRVRTRRLFGKLLFFLAAGLPSGVMAQQRPSAMPRLQDYLATRLSATDDSFTYQDAEYLNLTAELNQWASTHGGYISVPMRLEFLQSPAERLMFNQVKRERSKLTIRNGLIYTFDGKLLDSRQFEGGVVIFIMTWDGEFYAVGGERGRIQHSSLSGGLPVAAAGELQVVQGVLKKYADKSRRYKPAQFTSIQGLSELSRRGVSLSDVEMDIYQPYRPREDAEQSRLLAAGVPEQMLTPYWNCQAALSLSLAQNLEN